MRKRIDRTLRSSLADHLRNYIEMRQHSGYKFKRQASILFHFDQYLCKVGFQGHLTQNVAWDFATSNTELAKEECVRLYQIVRQFSEYLAIYEPDTPHLPACNMFRTGGTPPAYIYTAEELTRLHSAAPHAWLKNPLRGITLHAMFGLAASTGLRSSEVISLDRNDVRLDSGLLTIRCTKFQKDRLVPVHPTTLKVLRDYAALRYAHFPKLADSAFFLNMWGRRFSRRSLGFAFYQLACSTGVRKAGGRGPSFHDLRHTFAVRRLVAWYQEGKDVQAMLPLLATYMGHVNYSSTAYYLTATPELLALAAKRYDAFLKREDIQS